MVFTLTIVEDSSLPGTETISAVATITVLLSVIAYGITAPGLTERYVGNGKIRAGVCASDRPDELKPGWVGIPRRREWRSPVEELAADRSDPALSEAVREWGTNLSWNRGPRLVEADWRGTVPESHSSGERTDE